VVVQINSRGGDAFEGVGIYNVLRAHPATITVEVLGMAASAASIIAMAASDGRLLMARNAQLMVHRASALAMGNAADLRQFATILDRTDAALAETYAARAGISAADAADLMANETFFSAAEAISLGLADGLLDQDATPAPEAAKNLRINSRGDLAARLHGLGIAKAAAAKIAASGWAALSGEPLDADNDDTLDLDAVGAALRQSSTNLIAALRGT
jgi:ATP-dependent protease ClpP protease subunit